MNTPDIHSIDSAFAGQDWEAAYQQVQGELLALPAQELLPVRLNIPQSVAQAAGVIPELRKLRARIAEELSGFDLSRVDQLPQLTMALGYTHSMLTIAQPSRGALRAMAEEAKATRRVLLADARALSTRGLLDPGVLKHIGAQAGYQQMYVDLRNLVSIFRTHWDQVKGKSGVSLEEVNRAAALSSALVQALGVREQGAPEVSELREMRDRAYSAFVLAYNDVRRAVAYVRWKEGDVDTIIPSLHQPRPRSGRKSADTHQEEQPTQEAAGPTPASSNVVVLHPTSLAS